MGISAYLLKPTKQSELFDAMVMALDLAPSSEMLQESAAETPPALPPLRILLAEDSLVNQKLAIGLLERHGHSVAVANNGKEALSLVGSDAYDLVLMDVQMPEMDGLEATTLIRARERKTGKHVPIVAMTAHAMQGDRETCLAAGMDGYISKPIRAVKFFETLDAVLNGSGDSSPEPDSEMPAGPMNWSKAMEVVQGDRGLLKEIVETFLDECPQRLIDLRDSIRDGDHGLLQRAAHTLKGSMRYFGAAKAYDLADELESMGREGTVPETTQTVETLEAELDRLMPVLTTFVTTGRFISAREEVTE
jgi:CheY-like chemotaxis protein